MSIIQNQLESIKFQLQHIGQLQTRLGEERFEHVDMSMVDLMLQQAGRFSEEQLVDLAAQGDISGCTLTDTGVKLPEGTGDAYRIWCELGFPGLSLPVEEDGLGVPLSVQLAVQEIIDGANLSFGMLCINQRCAAKALMAAASPEHQQVWLPQLASGELSATIAISEPQAGSDVARISTRAHMLTEGQWQISGTKIWISYGDHDATDNILHLVLARTSAEGIRGLSLFAVPKLIDAKLNGVRALRLEEKMGLHASPTCVLELDNAIGYLIGEQGKGLNNLFHMMNAMRLAVSVQGSAVANVASLRALHYATERPQGGHVSEPAIPIIQHDDVRRMLLEMTAKSELLRALSFQVATYLDADETAVTGSMRKLAELMLPVAKTLGAEWGFEVASQGIQVLGGYGYTQDYPIERMARDVRVGAIYEGTSGIQANDFVHRKLRSDNFESIGCLMDIMRRDLDSCCAQGDKNPLGKVLPELLRLYQSVLTHLRTSEATRSIDTYAMLKLSGLLLCTWQGMKLYQAATSAKSAYTERLRQALTWFSVGLEHETSALSAKVLTGIPALEF